MRVTQRAVALTSLQGLNRNLDAVGTLQRQLTSGRLINAPSDSPTGTNRAMQTRAELASLSQEARNISDGSAWLEQTDSTLQNMIAMTRRLRDVTLQALNTGSANAASQQALATEAASLRGGLLTLANTNVQGRPLFGGVTPGQKAYDATGAYVGLAGPPVTRRVSEAEVLRVDITGPEVFGTPGDDLFAIAERIATDITADPTQVAGHLADLDVIMNRMYEAVADVGARAKRLDGLAQVNADRSLSLESQLAETENVDLPNTIMRLQMQQVGYEAALAATAKALSPTLLDYLR